MYAKLFILYMYIYVIHNSTVLLKSVAGDVITKSRVDAREEIEVHFHLRFPLFIIVLQLGWSCKVMIGLTYAGILPPDRRLLRLQPVWSLLEDVFHLWQRAIPHYHSEA